MQEPILPPDETTHSFVIRLWQEVPGQQRGTIRHVQSEARMAFTRLEQAVQWIERTTRVTQPTVDKPRLRNVMTGVRAWWATIMQYRYTPTLALAGTIAVILLVVVLTTPDVPGSLAGTSAGAALGETGLLPFLAGLFVGGLLVVLWGRSAPRR